MRYADRVVIIPWRRARRHNPCILDGLSCAPSSVLYNPIMPSRLEADIVYLNLAGGRPLPEDPPGLATFVAPRKAARGRERDTVFLCLSLRARAPLPAGRTAELSAELLQLAASTFFGVPGSITAAARQALAAVNQRLLEGNLREGAPVQGGLICAALRGDDFYAVQCGPGSLVAAHTTATERFPATAGRPLGLSDVLETQYFHTKVAAGEYLALSPAASWTDSALAGLGELVTLSSAAERLSQAAGGDVLALVARLEPEGSLANTPASPAGAAPSAFALPSLAGVAERLRRPARTEPEPRPEPASAETASPAGLPDLAAAPTQAAPEPGPASPETPAPAASEAAPAETNWQELLRRTERWAGETDVAAPPEPAPAPTYPAPAPAPALSQPAQAEADEIEAGEAADEPEPFQREPARRFGAGASAVAERAQRGLRSFGRAFGVTLTETARSLRRLMARALPEGTLQKEGLFTLPASALIGIAVLMPILIVALAGLIYIQRGQAEEYAQALQEAQVEVTKGRLAADPVAARPNWETALTWLARAEQLRPDQTQVAQLRLEAQTKLDELNATTRLDFIPLVPGGLGPDARLEQIVLGGRDVYALDMGQNRVWRLTPNTSGVYSVDPDFQCASGAIGPVTIGPLIDIGFVPGPNVRDGDAVIALDSLGALMYCTPGEPPLGSYLPKPDTGLAQPVAMELFGDSLYVLDVGRNQIWQYPGTGGVFNQPASGYFSSVVYDLKDVVEFTIAGGDLMLLRKDGRLSVCSRAQAFDTATCLETAQYTDQRPGRTGGDRLADLTAPRRLVYDQPPEPSLIVLNPENNGLYQLSLKLVFTRQFQPNQVLATPISAVAIDPAKRFFVTTRDGVYVAARP